MWTRPCPNPASRCAPARPGTAPRPPAPASALAVPVRVTPSPLVSNLATTCSQPLRSGQLGRASAPPTASASPPHLALLLLVRRDDLLASPPCSPRRRLYRAPNVVHHASTVPDTRLLQIVLYPYLPLRLPLLVLLLFPPALLAHRHASPSPRHGAVRTRRPAVRPRALQLTVSQCCTAFTAALRLSRLPPPPTPRTTAPGDPSASCAVLAAALTSPLRPRPRPPSSRGRAVVARCEITFSRQNVLTAFLTLNAPHGRQLMTSSVELRRRSERARYATRRPDQRAGEGERAARPEARGGTCRGQLGARAECGGCVGSLVLFVGMNRQ